MDAIHAIRHRRTHKVFTGAPVTRGQVERLIELATFAPNHKLTEPWRFFVVPHERIPELAAVVVNAIRPDDHPKLQRKRITLGERLPLLGAYITVGRQPTAADPRRDLEDYAACACAVQNICVAATAMGLGSFWSTGDIFERETVRAFLNIPPDIERVASLWLGVPARPAKTARRPASELTSWLGEAG